MNISDIITQAILDTLNQSGGSVQLKRNELANQIGCVPSQINYVITSRFTPEHGYILESKGACGCYIRIMKNNAKPHNMVMHVVNSIGNEIDENSARMILQNLFHNKWIEEKDEKIISSAVTNHILRKLPHTAGNQVRAELLKSMLLALIQ